MDNGGRSRRRDAERPESRSGEPRSPVAPPAPLPPVASRLAALGDRRLAAAVAAAPPLGPGIGGRTAELDVGGTPVFVKRVPLTELELRPEHARSTANLFALPAYYHYGLGSAGFGAWRELAAHLAASRWAREGAYGGFPVTYHWRVLPDSPPEGFADEFGGIDGAVAFWEGSPAVRRRLEALGRATSSLVLFLEHLPGTLADAREPGPDRTVAELERGARFMASRGLVHFDAHSRNVLTDGRRLLFTDFGLALSARFALAPDEARFLAAHLASYDRCFVLSEARRRLGADLGARGPAADLLDAFHRRLLDGSRRTPYPAAEIEAALAPERPPGGHARDSTRAI
ncbi:hypothetical protein GCM10009801_28350 [Streptomyces albiaxialis]|uniref:Protein kinase domain-containing protein n=1 Tax=Streptomyces albiaxialis TaxID=329523 RepID=A0ABN2VVZ4_9ACTN